MGRKLVVERVGPLGDAPGQLAIKTGNPQQRPSTPNPEFSASRDALLWIIGKSDL